MVQWHSISHLARTLKKKLWASCYLNVGWNNKCVKLWKEWKLHTWFFFWPFFVAIQNLHTSACNLHTKATFSVNITFRQPNFVNMHGKPMCMFGNLVFNISIHVKKFIYISFGAQSFVHFSAQTQLCSKSKSKLWPNNTMNTKFLGAHISQPPQNALYHTL